MVSPACLQLLQTTGPASQTLSGKQNKSQSQSQSKAHPPPLLAEKCEAVCQGAKIRSACCLQYKPPKCIAHAVQPATGLSFPQEGAPAQQPGAFQGAMSRNPHSFQKA